MKNSRPGRWFNFRFAWKRRAARRLLSGSRRSRRRGRRRGRWGGRRARSPIAIVITLVFIAFSVLASSSDSDDNDEPTDQQAIEHIEDRGGTDGVGDDRF